jgi:hypothetical protein
MNKEQLQIILEESKLPPEIVEEVLSSIDKKDDGSITVPTGLVLEDRLFYLKGILDTETDPRKKARIAARMISEKL